jgi:signal recognition particle subunit SRP54
LDNFDDREMDRVEAIIHSMTPMERRRPRILNGSRRARIARGAGVQVSDVNQLVERFGEAQKMMRQMRRGGGMPALPGMPGAAGKKSRGRTPQQQQPRRGKARSGNPAKRAQQERESAGRGVGAADAVPGGAFGLGRGAAQAPQGLDPGSVELPPGFEKFLGR